MKPTPYTGYHTSYSGCNKYSHPPGILGLVYPPRVPGQSGIATWMSILSAWLSCVLVDPAHRMTIFILFSFTLVATGLLTLIKSVVRAQTIISGQDGRVVKAQACYYLGNPQINSGFHE